MTSIGMYETILVTAIFGVGMFLGILLYRAAWHIDTSTLRMEIETLRVHNKNLLDDVIRLGRELQELRQRMEYMEGEESDMRAQIRLAAKRERQGG